MSRALATQSFIALEDLTGIRKRVNQQPRRKVERRRANSWAFYQQGARAGVKVVLVPPVYSSQTCHRCLWIGQRQGKHFRWVNPAWGWEGDGANGIALLGLNVN